MIQLHKYFQDTKGVSRREFSEMLNQQAIKINGELVTNYKYDANSGDKIEISLPDGSIYEETLEIKKSFRPTIVAFNKPKGFVVSKSDPHNRTIYELLPPSWVNDFYYIGRLDKDSRGLLLLTNQPEMVDYYENPKYRVIKIYEVEIDKLFKSNHIPKVKAGILVDQDGVWLKQDRNGGYLMDGDKVTVAELEKQGNIPETLKFFDIHVIKAESGGYKLRILLTEGKKRHIRRVLKGLGYKVLDLKRIKVGNYELGTLKSGKYRMFPVKNRTGKNRRSEFREKKTQYERMEARKEREKNKK